MKLSIPNNSIDTKGKDVMGVERKPFNDADEHYQKHVGSPSSVNMKQMPKPIRIIGYFFFGFMAIAAAFFLVVILLDKIL